MHTIKATYRVVTPMFCGGAEPTREAELRVPSFKGVLRFWWRALMWRNVGDVAELRNSEASFFGSSDSGQSRVLMRLEKHIVSERKITEQWSPASWQRYTGYGLRDKGERCFLPVCDWRLLLTVRRCDDVEIESLLSALKLFGLVGGLGSRARKGWGCTTLLAMDGAPWQCPANADTWRAAMRSLVGGDLPSSAPFTAATEGSRWNAGTIHPDAAAAQQWLGQRYRDSVKATEPKAARAQFGLPREFKKGTQPRRERRASPLFLHVHSCGGGKALPCALWLPAAFLENSPAIPGNGDAGRRFVETLDSTTAGQM